MAHVKTDHLIQSIMRCRVLWLCMALLVAGCSKSEVSGGELQCDAGFVEINDTCWQLCESDFKCATGQICDPFADTDVCVQGTRTTKPDIQSIDGRGSADGTTGRTDHRLVQSIVVNGANFTGTEASLYGPDDLDTGATLIARSATQLEMLLPLDTQAEGLYTLEVRGQAGNDNTTVMIMRGEMGESGFPGATYITGAALVGSNTNTSTATAISITNPKNQLTNARTFPETEAAGVLMTAINSTNHTLVDPAASNAFFTTADALAEALTNAADTTLVLLASRGDVSSWVSNSGLATLLKTFGASRGIRAIGSGDAFVMAGRKDLREGNGVLVVGSSSVHTTVTLVDGDIVGSSTENLGACINGDASCSVPAASITGTLSNSQLPQDTYTVINSTQTQSATSATRVETLYRTMPGFIRSSTSGGTTTYTPTTIQSLRIVASGSNYNGTAPERAIEINGISLASYSNIAQDITTAGYNTQAGINLAVFNRSNLQLTFIHTYSTNDCSDSGIQATTLKTKLDTLTSSDLVVLTTYGDWTDCFKTNILQGDIAPIDSDGNPLTNYSGLNVTAANQNNLTGLATALKRIGASSVVDIFGHVATTVYNPSTTARNYGQGSAYILVGIPENGTGIERVYPSGYGELAVLLQNGLPFGMGSTNATPAFTQSNCFSWLQADLAVTIANNLPELDRFGNWCPVGTYVAGFKYNFFGSNTLGILLRCCPNEYATDPSP